MKTTLPGQEWLHQYRYRGLCPGCEFPSESPGLCPECKTALIEWGN